MDHNQIEELPRDESGHFCGYADVESFSFAYNKLKKFPNIFSSQSVYVMSSVNFHSMKLMDLRVKRMELLMA